MTETVTFTGENGEQTVFYIEEQARVNGTDYLLVSDAPEGDANVLILKDISDEASAEAEYVPVEDEAELAALMKVFNEMTDDDTDILM